MGGRNHQPCKKYRPSSTMLSRCLSLAQAELELGNVALEDVILAELAGGQGGIEDILLHLRSSASSIEMAQAAAEALRQQMDDNDFVDLPTLRSADLDKIGEKFVTKNLVSVAAWRRIADLIRMGGFYASLAHIQASLTVLLAKTEVLIQQVGNLALAAAAGEIDLITEESRPGNFKVAFADLYTSWAQFSQDFLASSMLSTELWYSSKGYDSLVDSPEAALVR